MASTRFNVQLSTHAYSFQITVPSSVTVLELKNRIAETCPGRPDRTGQRIIWQGRVIDDTSVVADVWTVSILSTVSNELRDADEWTRARTST